MGPVIEAFAVGLAPVGLNSLTLTSARPAFDNLLTMATGALHGLDSRRHKYSANQLFKDQCRHPPTFSEAVYSLDVQWLETQDIELIHYW